MNAVNKSVKIQYHRNTQELYESGINYATKGSLGLDLRACFSEENICIQAGERYLVPSGISIEILMEDVGAFVYSRSGLGAKKGLTVAQGVGVIDKDYRGEIMVMLLNTSKEEQVITKGERIAQLVFQPAFQLEVIESQNLSDTERGAGGFGHTGTS